MFVAKHQTDSYGQLNVSESFFSVNQIVTLWESDFQLCGEFVRISPPRQLSAIME